MKGTVIVCGELGAEVAVYPQFCTERNSGWCVMWVLVAGLRLANSFK